MYSKITMTAPAKINLILNVKSKRDDGYHCLETILQSVDLCDTVTIERTNTPQIEISCSKAGVPCDERNIAHRVATEFLRLANISDIGLKIHIDKRIPMEAGLAGGSADGAAVILGLDRLLETNIHIDKLSELAFKIGADIPFCMQGGTALVDGVGDRLVVFPSLCECHIVVAKPHIGVSTKDCFERFDSLEIEAKPDIMNMVKVIVSEDLDAIGANMMNVLEYAANLEEVPKYKEIMLSCQAKGAVMTGSGSAVIGMFDDEHKAKNCYEKLKGIADEVFICKPTEHGAIVKEIE